MRVITGTARGMKLKTLEGLDVRPTTDRMKETVFSAVQFEVPGSNVLDLYAGSGQMGIEALSRGASRCVFVDGDRRSSQVQIENLRHTKLFDRSRVVTMTAQAYLASCKETFNIIFMDPPYHSDETADIIRTAFAKVEEGGCLLCETASDEDVDSALPEDVERRVYRHGKIKITLFRKG